MPYINHAFDRALVGVRGALWLLLIGADIMRLPRRFAPSLPLGRQAITVMVMIDWGWGRVWVLVFFLIFIILFIFERCRRLK